MANYTLSNLPQNFSVGDTITVSHTGSYQTLPFKNQKAIKLELYGGRGGNIFAYDINSTPTESAISSYPFKVSGEYRYANSESLYLFVGGNGNNMYRLEGTGIRMEGDNWTDSYVDPPSYNGGGAGSTSYYKGAYIHGVRDRLFSSGGGCTDVRTTLDVGTQILVSPGSGGCTIYFSNDYNGFSLTNGSNLENGSGIRLNGSTEGGGGYYGGTHNMAGTSYYDAAKITAFSKSSNEDLSSLALITILEVTFDVKSLYRYII